MLSKPLVSIIIPCKNIDNYTTECVDHCKRLEYPNFEIILLPDFSSDVIDGVKVITPGR